MRRVVVSIMTVALAVAGFAVPAYAIEDCQDASVVVESTSAETDGQQVDATLPADDGVNQEEPRDGEEQGGLGQTSATTLVVPDDSASDDQTAKQQAEGTAEVGQGDSGAEVEAQPSEEMSTQEVQESDSDSVPDEGEETEDEGRVSEVVSIAPQSSEGESLTTTAGKVTTNAKANTLASFWQVFEYADGTFSYCNAKTGTWLAADGAEVGSPVGLRSDSDCRWRLHSLGENLFSLALAENDDLRLESFEGAEGLLLRLAYALESVGQSFAITRHQGLSEAVESGEVVDSGLVSISTKATPNKVLDVNGGSKSDKANVHIYDSNSSLAQKWELVYKGSGLYSLRSACSAKMLDVWGGSTKSGANVDQYTANETLAQLWYFVSNDGVLSLRSAASGLALEVKQGLNANGTNIQLGTYTGSSAQSIVVNPTVLLEDNGVYTFRPECATSLFVVANGDNAELGNAANYLRQYWRVSGNDASFTLKNLAGKSLMINGTPASAADVLCTTGTASKWEARIGVNGGIVLSPLGMPNLVLDITGASTKAGANVHLYSSNNTNAQNFRIVLNAPLTDAARRGVTIAGKVVTVSSALDRKKVLDIKNAAMANAANVQIYTNNGTLAQKWELVSVGNGLYTLRVANSGRMLDVKGGSSVSGANVQQYASNGTLAQHWYLVSASNGGYMLCSAKSSLALDVMHGKNANGTNVQVYTANGSNAQRFYLDDAQLVPNGTHGIAWSACKPLVLDVKGGSKAAGANIQIYIANGSAAQQFVFAKQSDGTYTIKNKQSGLYLQVKDGSKTNGANVEQGNGTQGKAAYWRIVIAPQGGLSFQNVNSGKYLEVAGEALRLSTNVRQGSTNATACQNFVTVAAGYNPKIAKIGWQNPAGLPQVSRYSVVLPSYATGTHTYVTPSAIRVDATREECIEAFISRAYDYLGTTFNEPWSTEPGGVGVDCSGLVLQCLYATGMDLENAAGTKYVGGYNPYNHYYVPEQTYNSARWYENGTFKRVSKSSMERGDLIFYGYYDDYGSHVYHVAIYLGNGKIIHSCNYAGSGNKVRVDNMYVSLYQTIIGVERPFV